MEQRLSSRRIFGFLTGNALTFPRRFAMIVKLHMRCAKLAQSVEQRIRNAQVVSSSLTFGSMKEGLRSALAPFFRGVAQFGSAFGSGPKGRGFKSRHLDQQTLENQGFLFCADFRNFSLLSTVFLCHLIKSLGMIEL